MAETWMYYWTDRAEHAYVLLRQRECHWRVEWGLRDPPGGDKHLEQGVHETSVLDDAIRHMLARVRELAEDPSEAERVEHKLREAIAAVERSPG